jgi:hypothetical protein
MKIARYAARGQIDPFNICARGRQRVVPAAHFRHRVDPEEVLIEKVAPNKKMRDVPEHGCIVLIGRRRARRLKRADRLDAFRRMQRRCQPEVAALAVRENDAGVELARKNVLGALRALVVGRPAGNELVHEGFHELDREAHTRVRASRSRVAMPCDPTGSNRKVSTHASRAVRKYGASA